MENQIIENIIQEKPIQDRLRQASCITVESALRNKVNLNIAWYDVHGEQQNQKYTISAGSIIEF
jgi:low affinity Fe/Cu permease